MDTATLSMIGSAISDYGFPIVVAGYLIYSIQPQLKALNDTVTELKAVVQTSLVNQQQLMSLIDMQNQNAVKVAEALARLQIKLDSQH